MFFLFCGIASKIFDVAICRNLFSPKINEQLSFSFTHNAVIYQRYQDKYLLLINTRQPLEIPRKLIYRLLWFTIQVLRRNNVCIAMHFIACFRLQFPLYAVSIGSQTMSRPYYLHCCVDSSHAIIQ